VTTAAAAAAAAAAAVARTVLGERELLQRLAKTNDFAVRELLGNGHKWKQSLNFGPGY